MKLIAINDVMPNRIRELKANEKAPGVQDALTEIYLLSHGHRTCSSQTPVVCINAKLLNLNTQIATKLSKKKKIKEAFSVFRYLTEAKTLANTGYTICMTGISEMRKEA